MKLQVTELSHDDLVNIFSTGLFGNPSMDVEYCDDDYDAVPEDKRIGKCFEDKIADILLNGGLVEIIDLEENMECGITLQNILDACSSKEGLPYMSALLIEENGDFYDGYNLLQIACFGEVVYG